ncbi:uncharacterized protein [Anoplolepis gracilipes]|uniref:uncharacterized protein n=3 Tax=Anoplolepis gracilipes TaxID=354296 RepID=UPI003BA0EA22
MSLRKNLKNLSTSQKNRRLLKACNKCLQSDIVEDEAGDNKVMCSSEIVHLFSDNEIFDENVNFSTDTNSSNDEENYYIENINDDDELNDIIDDDRISVNKNDFNVKEQLNQWICDYNITHRAIGVLLKILKNIKNVKELEDLPLDSRTLLNTPKHTVTREVPRGKYFHYGLENALIDILKTVRLNIVPKNLEININIDGLLLTKSSKSQFYPILGEIYLRICEPFVIGTYHGYSKPDCPNDFLKDFIKEYISLQEKGLKFNGKYFTVKIRCVICDSPARSFVKCTKAFNGYFGCSKCMQEGDLHNHRMIFLEMSANLRTDENFVNQENEEHHTGRSIFERANLGMNPYVIFLHGYQVILHGRHVAELERWKATELRLFLLYPFTITVYMMYGSMCSVRSVFIVLISRVEETLMKNSLNLQGCLIS